MKIEVFPDAESVAREAAKLIAEEARTAVAARGKFVMAVSGVLPDHSQGNPKIPNRKTSNVPMMTTTFQRRFLFMT